MPNAQEWGKKRSQGRQGENGGEGNDMDKILLATISDKLCEPYEDDPLFQEAYLLIRKDYPNVTKDKLTIIQSDEDGRTYIYA